jgi:hypothetical protein
MIASDELISTPAHQNWILMQSPARISHGFDATIASDNVVKEVSASKFESVAMPTISRRFETILHQMTLISKSLNQNLLLMRRHGYHIDLTQ